MRGCVTNTAAAVVLVAMCLHGAAAGGGPATLNLSNGKVRTRSLQQAACAPLQVAGKSYTFDNCEDLSATVGSPFTVYYTLVPSATGVAFKGAIKAKSSGYASIAFNPTGGMIGADAVIVYPDSGSPTGASVDGYKLESYNAAAINAAKGSYPLTDTAAEATADGSLAAVFTATLDGAAANWAGTTIPLLYVNNGAMQGGGSLGTHITTSSRFGNVKVTLKATTPAAPATPAVPAPVVVPAPVQEPSVVPAPVAELPVAAGALDSDDDDDDDDDGEGGAAVGLPDFNHEEHEGHAEGKAGASTPTCTVTIAGKTKSYNACYSVTKMAPDFMVHFSMDPDPADTSSSILSMAIDATHDGYLSVGFPKEAGKMVDATALIVQNCASCGTGASMAQYYMSGYAVQDVAAANNMAVTGIEASAQNGKLAGAFKVKLPGVSASGARRRLMQAFSAASFPLIYAVGPITSSGGLQKHTDEGAGDLDLALGLTKSTGDLTEYVDVTDSTQEAQKMAHMWIMTIGWGLLVPLGIFTARYFRQKGCWWFRVHQIGMSLTFVLVLVGLVLGFTANGGWETDVPVHRDLGIAATALACVQVTALVVRPAPEHHLRSTWSFIHSNIGRSAAILAISNIYYGIIKVEELGTWAWAAYTGVLGAVVLAAVFMEVQRARGGQDVMADGKSVVDPSPVGTSHDGTEFITSVSAAATKV